MIFFFFKEALGLTFSIWRLLKKKKKRGEREQTIKKDQPGLKWKTHYYQKVTTAITSNHRHTNKNKSLKDSLDVFDLIEFLPLCPSISNPYHHQFFIHPHPHSSSN